MKYKFKSGYAVYLAPVDGEGGDGSGGGAPGATDPAPTPGAGTEDLAGLKSALNKERDRAAQLDKQFKALQESIKGIDPEKYKQLEQLQASAEEWNQKEATIRQDLETTWQQKVVAEQNTIKQLRAEIQGLRQLTQAEKAYAAAGGRTGGSDDGVTFFEAFYANVQGALRINDKGQVEVVDKAGARIFSKKNTSEPMTPAEYFAEMKSHPVYGHYFQPTNNAKGGGASPSNGTVSSRQDLSGLSRADRITAAREGAGRV